MIRASAHPIEASLLSECSRWVVALESLRLDHKNEEKMIDFFFTEFARRPERFLHFLRHYRKHMLKSTKTHMRDLANRYLRILSPLAERFGIFREKSDIDTLCFRILKPTDYRRVMSFIKRYDKNASLTIRRVQNTLKKLLDESGTQYTIKGRFKEPYSIFRKMEKRGSLAPVKLHDIFAFRIILDRDDRDQCFEVLNLLHDRFIPLPQRFKDYITIPKGNGYQSIHTCIGNIVEGVDFPIEVQIRTRIMDNFAEQGLASHWLYARSKQSLRMTRTEKRLLQHMKALSAGFQSRGTILCLTRDGDATMLPVGATVLDFAYLLHTELGHRTQGGCVNGKAVSMNHPLYDLDRVEIIAGKSIAVSEKWLEYVTSDSSRRKIYAHARH